MTPYFWSVLSLTLAALSMGMSFAHTLEMPVKLGYEGPLWLRVQHSLYRFYGTLGGVIEIAAIAGAVVLGWMLRDWRPSFITALAGAGCFAAAFAVWLAFTNLVNAQTARWTTETLPADWRRWRKRWEVSHAVRFALHFAGFLLLVLAMLISPLGSE